MLARNGAGGAHAAALPAVLELAGYLALLLYLGESEHAISHSVTVHLQAVARVGERVEARGTVDGRTTRIAFLTVAAAVGPRLVARAQLAKSIVAMGGG